MRIGKPALAEYRRSLETLAAQASQFVSTAIDANAGIVPGHMDEADVVAFLRDQAISAISATIDSQSMVAQSLAMQLYDMVCATEGIDTDDAIVFPDAIDKHMMTEKVHYFAGSLVDGNLAKFERNSANLAATYVRRSAFENTVRNCDANHVRYARIPQGGETCEFCMMLASRGFVYHTETTAWAHGVHANCRCIVMPSVKGRTVIAGYDPDEWYARWQEAEEGKRERSANPKKVKGQRVHRRTGSMSSSEYAEYRRELASVRGKKQIWLPKAEYAEVMSEINTRMSDEDRKHAIVSKEIGNYCYTFINRGFDDYVIIRKRPLF